MSSEQPIDIDFNTIPELFNTANLPDTFEGRVTQITGAPTNEGGQSLHMYVKVTACMNAAGLDLAGKDTMIMYRLPKFRTGQGQGEYLNHWMRNMGMTNTRQLIDKRFLFERHSLADFAKVTGNTISRRFTDIPRHYPVKYLPDTPAQ